VVGTKFKKNYVGLNPVPMVLGNDSRLAQILAQTMILNEKPKTFQIVAQVLWKKSI